MKIKQSKNIPWFHCCQKLNFWYQKKEKAFLCLADPLDNTYILQLPKNKQSIVYNFYNHDPSQLNEKTFLERSQYYNMIVH